MPQGAWLVSYVVLWVLLLLQLGVLVVLLRLVHRLSAHWLQNDPGWGLPPGSVAPALAGEPLWGTAVPRLGAGEEHLVVFLSPSCVSCKAALSRLPAVSSAHRARVVAVVAGTRQQAGLLAAPHRGSGALPPFVLLADPEGVNARNYHVTLFPSSVVVGADGLVAGKGHAVALSEFHRLLRGGALRRPDSTMEGTAAWS